MKRYIYLIFFVFLVLSSSNKAQNFYDINSVRKIEIFFAQQNWDKILDSLKKLGTEERLIAKIKIDGIEFDSVGIKYKGNSTYNPNNKKNPFNIKLDFVRDNQNIQEYKNLILGNGFKDPSFLREVLSYEIARKYMPASNANWANLFINGNLHGVYMNVQDVDKYFVQTHFFSDENPRFKGEIAKTNPPPALNVWGYLGSDSSLYKNYYELNSDYGWNDLISFLNTFNNNPSLIENILNLDLHLWMLAFELLNVNLDSPVNYGHNFYLYKDDEQRFNPLMWDLNECFGGFTNLLTGGQLNFTQMQQLTPFLNAAHPAYNIVNKIFSNAAFKKKYVTHMKTMIEENFSNNWYKTRGVELQNKIAPFVQLDTNKFFSYNGFIANLNTAVSGGGPNQNIIGITQLMDARINYLNSLPEFTAVSPQLSNAKTSANYAQPNTLVWFNVNAQNASSVKLFYRTKLISRFNEIDMFDDGNHNDSTAGDGKYGISLVTGLDDIHYYFYAENNNAGSFLPKRAEFEFFTLQVGSNVVINEFMADNFSTVQDSSGEYDDWIEFFNNTDSSFNLEGYFLSDKFSNLSKWIFPNVSIPPKSYLIVWADENGNQPGLHANFKLTNSGEVIYFSSPDTIIIDQIAFGLQKTDISLGRFPNGTGNFIFMSPSFKAANHSGILNIKNEKNIPNEFILYQNYPNPFSINNKNPITGNPATTINFQLVNDSYVTLKIFNLLGKEITVLLDNEWRESGKHSIQFSTIEENKYLPSGVYFYQLSTGSFTETKKMILMR